MRRIIAVMTLGWMSACSSKPPPAPAPAVARAPDAEAPPVAVPATAPRRRSLGSPEQACALPSLGPPRAESLVTWQRMMGDAQYTCVAEYALGPRASAAEGNTLLLTATSMERAQVESVELRLRVFDLPHAAGASRELPGALRAYFQGVKLLLPPELLPAVQAKTPGSYRMPYGTVTFERDAQSPTEEWNLRIESAPL